ncbi:hypothetical protein PC116_g31552, partial [Phytophthora cactorum]
LFPHVKSVVDRFHKKLPKDDLKKFSKEINKKLVASDYKNNRVDDPTSISEKQQRKVKEYVKDFFNRAVEKYRAREQKKAERANEHNDSQVSQDAESTATPAAKDEDTVMTDDEGVSSTPGSLDRKRKREDDVCGSPSLTPSETPSMKRVKEDESDVPSPPPPPPPPLDGEATMEIASESDKMFGEQDSPLAGKEEAQRVAAEVERQKLREQEAALERENELNMLAFEREQHHKLVNGNSHIVPEGLSQTHENANGGLDSAGEDGAPIQHSARKHEVMSH